MSGCGRASSAAASRWACPARPSGPPPQQHVDGPVQPSQSVPVPAPAATRRIRRCAPMSGQARHARGVLGPDLLRPVFGVVAGPERAFQGHRITRCSNCPRAEPQRTGSCRIAVHHPSASSGRPWRAVVTNRVERSAPPKAGQVGCGTSSAISSTSFPSDHSTPPGPAPFGAPEPPLRIHDRAIGVDPASRWSSQTSQGLRPTLGVQRDAPDDVLRRVGEIGAWRPSGAKQVAFGMVIPVAQFNDLAP
jgi:hypothetical protein